MRTQTVDIIFEQDPEREDSLRFVDIVDENGKELRVGEWLHGGETLRLTVVLPEETE